MNKSIKRPYVIVLLLLFFLSVPLFQSLIFSTQSEGAMYINKKIQIDFIKSDKKNILLYFGYVGCADVCTPFLYKLSDLYKSKDFQTLKEDTDVFFINLTPDIEPSQADMFAKFFNQNFKGVYLSKKELFAIDRSFSLFFSDNLNEPTQINHTDYLYHIKNEPDSHVLKSIYFTHPLSNKKLIDDMIKKNYR